MQMLFKCKNSKLSNHGLTHFDPQRRPLTSATTPDQSGPGSDGNERVFHIPQVPA